VKYSPSNERIEFLNNLKKGDVIDVIKSVNEFQDNSRIWSKAEVVLNQFNLVVRYIGDP